MLHAAFFLGPKSFYRRLREMDPATLGKLRMSAVSYTNELYGDQDAKTRARVKGRFINSAMMATLLGALVSDGLEDGRVVSGVGGQHNFVSQAFALPDARSIISVKATRRTRAKVESNIRYAYGHVTIPRHERDIIVSEYGIADLRGKPDDQVIAAMLAVADSRFQPELLRATRRTRARSRAPTRFPPYIATTRRSVSPQRSPPSTCPPSRSGPISRRWSRRCSSPWRS